MKHEMMDKFKYAVCGAYMMGDKDAEEVVKNILKVLRTELLRKHADINDSDYYSTIDFINGILDYE